MRSKKINENPLGNEFIKICIFDKMTLVSTLLAVSLYTTSDVSVIDELTVMFLVESTGLHIVKNEYKLNRI